MPKFTFANLNSIQNIKNYGQIFFTGDLIIQLPGLPLRPELVWPIGRGRTFPGGPLSCWASDQVI